jgi:tyrosine-protein kinase Etk/Wzc
MPDTSVLLPDSPASDASIAVDARVEELPSRDLGLLDLLIVLAEHKRLILSSAFAVAMVAAGLSLLIANRYTGTTKIMPPQQNPSFAMMMGPLGGALNSITGGSGSGGAAQLLGLKNANEIYVTMLKSRTIEEAMIQRFGLMQRYHAQFMSAARKSLEGATQINLSSKDSVITIEVEDKDPKIAAAMANAYVEELRKLTQTIGVTESSQRRIFFERELENVKDKLATAEQALKQTQQNTGLIDLEDQGKAIVEGLVKLRADIAVKEVELNAMRMFGTERNPDIRLAQSELDEMREQLTALERKSGAGNGDIQVATREVPQIGMEYVRKVRDVKYYETIFELLAKQYEAAKLDESRDTTIIQVIETAVEPDRKSGPHRAAIVLAAMLITFVCVTLFVLRTEAIRQNQDNVRKIKTLYISLFGQLGLRLVSRMGRKH